MELPYDIQRKIALDLPPYDLISLCRVDKDTNKNICNSDKFWRLKLQKDFPEIVEFFDRTKLPIKNPKVTYIRNFIALSELIEHQVNKILSKKTIRKKLYKVLYDSYNDIRLTFDAKTLLYMITYKYIEFDNAIKVAVNRNIEKYDLNEVIPFLLYGSVDDIITGSPLNKYLR